jgi:hypothetical protein
MADARPDAGVGCTRHCRRTALGWAALATAIALAACGRSDDRNGAAPASGSDQPVAIVDVAAVNALVPPSLTDRLVFEKRDLVIERGKRKTTYTLAAPRDWAQRSKMFAHLRADDKAAPFTRLEVGSSCDGECSPKAWQPIVDRVSFAPRAKGKVLKDERGPGRRTMIAVVDSAGATMTEIVVAWWTDGARSYHTCTASLGEAFKEAAAAFDRACQAVAIDGDD